MTVEFICGQCGRPEFRGMFGGWLTEHRGRTFLVDCGVGSGSEDLVKNLKDRLGGTPLDYVLLTHVHLDHAGGLGAIFAAWPEARAVVHQNGLKHLVNPERLWAGTRVVMGEDVAQVYAKPQPLDDKRLISHTVADLQGLTIFQTPGHAPHHLSFRLGDVVFAGEAAGCPVLVDGRLYCRPATPPRYFPADVQSSIERLFELPDGIVYCGHTREALPFHDVLRQSLAQLKLWDEILRHPEGGWDLREGVAGQLERLTTLVLQEDSNLAPFRAMTGADFWREKYYLGNSVRGFLEYYATVAGNLEGRP